MTCLNFWDTGYWGAISRLKGRTVYHTGVLNFFLNMSLWFNLGVASLGKRVAQQLNPQKRKLAGFQLFLQCLFHFVVVLESLGFSRPLKEINNFSASLAAMFGHMTNFHPFLLKDSFQLPFRLLHGLGKLTSAWSFPRGIEWFWVIWTFQNVFKRGLKTWR